MTFATSLAKAGGAKRILPLQVAGAFHAECLMGTTIKMDKFVADIPFSDPLIPVLSNVTGLPNGGAESIREAMVQRVTSSVGRYEGMEWLEAEGVDCDVECGSGDGLTGLLKRIDKGASLANIHDLSILKRVRAGA